MTDDPFAEYVALMPFAELIGLRLTAVGADEVVGEFDWRADLCTAGGILHGGALMAAADSVGAVCACQHLPEGATTATIESKTNLFRAGRQGTVHVVSRPLHVGRTNIVVQTDLFDADERRISQTTQTQAVLQPR